jgi:predicted Zn finger-like uncharacterized protein
MSQVNITCPNCGFSKDVARQKIPAGLKQIKCPQCQESFVIEPVEEVVAEPPNLVSAAPVNSQTQTEDDEMGFDPSPQFKFCSTCGQRLHVMAELCPKCGVRVAPPANAINKVALLLITFFLGGLGAHKFYQKKYLLGTLYLLFFWTYIPTLASLVEFFIYAFKSETELQQRYPEAGSGGVVIAAVVIPLVGIAMIGILAAIAIPQFAAYREKAYNVAAKKDLVACKSQVEAYHSENQVYPSETGQVQCQTSKCVALYYLPLGSDEYQLISFHDKGKKAYLGDNNSPELAENTREEIERQLEADYGSTVLERKFHFME